MNEYKYAKSSHRLVFGTVPCRWQTLVKYIQIRTHYGNKKEKQKWIFSNYQTYLLILIEDADDIKWNVSILKLAVFSDSTQTL